jgi:hypothetical protein
MPLAERNYASFHRTDRAYVLVTSTEDKARRSPDWASAFRSAAAAVSAQTPAAATPTCAERTAAVYVVFGSDRTRLAAVSSALAQTAGTVTMPAATVLVELSAQPAFAQALSGVKGLLYRHIPVPPRAAGVWQKEALWEIARRQIAIMGGIRYAAFIDADVVPDDPAWFARIQAAHDTGIKVMQPWRKCTDPDYPDIGGISDSWLRQHTGGDYSMQSGFAWSFDLAWLEEIGGLPCVEPLGGGDNLLRNLCYGPDGRIYPEARHMRAMASASQIPKQPPHALDVDLTHHSHGPRSGRQYRLRYRIANLATDDIMALHERHPTGVLVVKEGPLGDAWLQMLSRRSEWTDDPQKNTELWHRCQAIAGPPQ